MPFCFGARQTKASQLMPIKVPDNLPAMETLTSEGVDLITERTAARQDIRPLRLMLLNLMPKKKTQRSSLLVCLVPALYR